MHHERRHHNNHRRPGRSVAFRAQIIRLADEMGYEKKRRGRVVGIILLLGRIA
jgi:hypothetical protein